MHLACTNMLTGVYDCLPISPDAKSIIFFLGIQSFADMFSCVELEAVARRYIFQHFLEVVQHEEYLGLEEDRLIKLLQSDQLQVFTENLIPD